MPQPVKISDELISNARETAAVMERSIAGQIEHWAKLGQAIEPTLQTKHAKRLISIGESLGEAMRIGGTEEGRKKLATHLKSRPYPHFEGVPGKKGMYVRIDKNGARTTGRFVNREFKPVA